MTASDKTIFRRRNRRNPYTTISNTPLHDKRLSLEAIGLLVCVLSLPEHWSFSRKDAIARFRAKRDKLDRILRELKDIGYVFHEQVRDEKGRLSHSIYIFSDEPGQFDETEPCPEKPETVTVSGKAVDGLAVSGKTAPIKRKQRDKQITEESASAPDFEISWKRWENRVRGYIDRKGRWPADKWGPPPGEPGCKVPRLMLEKYQIVGGL